MNSIPFYPQLELGSTATDYEPPTGITLPIAFPASAGTVYGGTLTVNPDRTGTLVVEGAAVTFNGSENWSKFSNANPNGTYFGLTATVPFATDGWKTAISNIFTPAVHDGLNNGEGFYWSGNAYRILYGAVGGTEELANFKAFLTEHNAMIVAKLATPITYALTPEQVSGILTTLYGTNNIWADTGNIKKLTYRADLGKYIDSHITAAVANALNA